MLTVKRIVEEEIEFIYRIVQGRLIIPDFSNFCSTVSEIYAHCKDNHTGTVRNQIADLYQGAVLN